jgi:cytochrome c oxidase subunit 2
MSVLDGFQSALNPHGHDSAIIAEIAWVLFAGGGVIFVAVMAMAAYALFARRERAARLGTHAAVVGGGIVFPAVTLAALLLYSLVRANDLSTFGAGRLQVEVTGEQWWWRVHYLTGDGRVDFATANEIHVPVGEPVDLRLKSADVIHSFWVPALAGKLDMLPGRENTMRIVATRPGTFRGQCAEYCGGPHSHMAFVVVAHEPEAYREWARSQRRDAAPAPGHRRAVEILEAQCAACHAIRGTRAAGTRGPDLTHLGTRQTIGAGRLPMNAGTIAGWIAGSQKLKPGNLMPEFRELPGEDLRAVAEYLASAR